MASPNNRMKAYPEFNHVLYDLHVETAGQMIDFIFQGYASEFLNKGE